MPDLKIQNVRYSFIYFDRTTPDHVPRQAMGLYVKDLEFYIMIKNIGTADWEEDLCIYYNLDQGREQDVIRIEDLDIPYAQQAEVYFTLKILMRRPKIATIIINPADADSTDGCEFVKEAFYNNNIVQIDFDK